MRSILVITLLGEMFSAITCSAGDRSFVYQKCLKTCVLGNCSEDGILFARKSQLQQDIWSSILQWSCRDECSYHCMWHSVEKFKEEGWDTPKFHGKWPFTRFLGVQEPAAAFSSLLNLAANAYMYMKIRREFPFRSSALAVFWHIFVFVCMNAWVWSTIFHTRDKPFTEFMDYACALSMVMGLFVAAIVRAFRRRWKLAGAIVGATLFYFVVHVLYLYEGSFDYDYNMKVNIFFGACGALAWAAWARRAAARGRRHARGAARGAAAGAAALALALLDFPPWRGAWDAHALWHLATAPLPLLFYKFVIEDLRFLQSGQYDKFDLKLT